ncbi:MAG: DUF4418 family protein [Actinobacteria bacterium]|nr:DUF4418 family protein [Actinomycetota bacterium]
MGNERVWKLVGAVGVLVGIVIALTPFNLAHVCTGMMEMKSGMPAAMKCNWMGVAEVFLGLLIAFNGLLIILAKNGWGSLSLMLGALGIAVIIIPTHLGIGVCKNPAMACHTTKTILTTSGAALIVAAFVGWLPKRSRG